MLVFRYARLVLISLILSDSGVTSGFVNRCTEEKCSEPLTLVESTQQGFKISGNSAEFYIETFPAEITLIRVVRRRLSIYCVADFPVLKQGGCEEKETIENPTPDEIRTWERKGIFPTGKECEPEGSCISEYASHCKEFGQYTVSNGPKTLKWKGRRWDMWTRDRCTQSWACSLDRYSSRVMLEFNEKGETEMGITTDKRVVLIDKALYDVGVKENDGAMSTLENPLPLPKRSMGKALCFSSSIDNIRCVFEELDGVENVPVEIDHNMEGKSSNSLIRLRGNLTIVSEGKVKTVLRTKTNNRETLLKEYYSSEGPDSVKDVLQLSLFSMHNR